MCRKAKPWRASAVNSHLIRGWTATEAEPRNKGEHGPEPLRLLAGNAETLDSRRNQKPEMTAAGDKIIQTTKGLGAGLPLPQTSGGTGRGRGDQGTN